MELYQVLKELDGLADCVDELPAAAVKPAVNELAKMLVDRELFAPAEAAEVAQGLLGGGSKGAMMFVRDKLGILQ